MPRPWKRPTLPPSPLGELNRALHELHHRAGWPSSRRIREALDDKGVSISHTKIHDTLAKPALPTKGAVEMITEVLAGMVRGADVDTEVDRLLDLWDTASLAPREPAPTTPKSLQKQTFTQVKHLMAQESTGAEQRLREEAEDGDTFAMNRLGHLAEDTARMEEAEEWYRRAADAGDVYAMGRLGDLLEKTGRLEEAEEWYRKAAISGDVLAKGHLKSLLEKKGRWT